MQSASMACSVYVSFLKRREKEEKEEGEEEEEDEKASPRPRQDRINAEKDGQSGATPGYLSVRLGPSVSFSPFLLPVSQPAVD